MRHGAPRSIVADATRQAQLIIKMAEHCEKMGYFFALHGLNPDASTHKPFGYFVGGMGAFVEAWAETHGRRYLRINIFHYGEPMMHFKFRVRRTARLRQLVVALEMFAKRRKSRREQAQGSGLITSTEMSNVFEFSGKGTEALEVVVGVLNMPHHRTILTAPYRPKNS